MGLSLAAPALAMAQDRDRPAGDVKVRVESAPFQGEARLLDWTADSLHLMQEGAGQPITIPRHTVTSLEAGFPRTPVQGFFRRASQGFLVGAFVGGGTQYLYCRSSGTAGDSWLNPSGCAVLGGIIFGILGMGIGGIVGAIHPGTRWDSMELSRADVYLGEGEAVLSVRF
ncbi:MAG: hypothetical protein EA352_02010 [Gemmatimonadales bacterium]|nr:MAG: hypothetical protein EA352_02010 [Gemmatimonadales bacterium]